MGFAIGQKGEMMDDTISRKAAIDALRDEFKRTPTTAIRAMEALKSLPSAQPEIIRCKDCKYYKTKFCALDTWTNEITIYNAQPDDFCSRAKRRGENDG